MTFKEFKARVEAYEFGPRTDAELEQWIENMWHAMWNHEMREHMTRHHSKVHNAH